MRSNSLHTTVIWGLSYLLLVFTASASAQTILCDSSFSRYDLTLDDPDHSHPAFQLDRWRCVTRTTSSDGSISTSLGSFANFTTAVSECAASAQGGVFSTTTDNYELAIDAMDASIDTILAGGGTVSTNEETQLACFDVGNGPDETDTPLSELSGYELGIIPTTYKYYSGTSNGQTIQSAALIPWGFANEDNPSADQTTLHITYTPEMDASYCHDPLCEAGATGSAQRQYSPVEPGIGTVDLALPLFSSAFPGLVPLAVHYSSHGAIKQADGTASGSGQRHSWRLTYDKYITTSNFGPGTVGPNTTEPMQINILTPGDDLLVFERTDGIGNWVNISHPGVKTDIRSLGGGRYEASRPDGYTERYDSSGYLDFVRYPDGREITITRHLGMTEIRQNHPVAAAVVITDLLGAPQAVYDYYNPNFMFGFIYADATNGDDNNPPHGPLLQGILWPDGTQLRTHQRHHNSRYDNPYLDSISLNNITILNINYDDDGKATGYQSISGENYGFNHGNNDVTVSSPYGASYTINTQEANVATTTFWGDTRVPHVTSVNCDDCGFSESTQYDSDGVIRSQSRSGELPYTATFDSNGLLAHLSFDGSKQRSYQWSGDGRELNSVSGSDILPLSLTYADGRVDSLTLAGSRTLSMPRVNGQIGGFSGIGNEQISITHTSRGFVQSVSNRTGSTYQFDNHNHLGQPQQVTDPNGIVSTLTYDIMGRVLSAVRDGETQFNATYTPLGQLNSLTVDGETLSYGYDNQLRLATIASSIGRQLNLGYQSNGLIQSLTDSDNGYSRTSNLSHGAEGNLTQLSSNIAGGNERVDYNYRGQVTRVVEGTNTTTYDYNHNAYLTGSTTNGESTTYGRDALGRLTSLSTPGGIQTTFAYTALGEQQQQANPNWGARNYTFAANGNLDQHSTGLLTHTYSHDNSDRVSRIVQSHQSSNTPNMIVNFGYDDTSNGNIGQGRLTEVENGYAGYRYRYDRRGNLIEQQVSVDTSNSPSAISFGSNDRFVDYDYNPHDRLNEITYPSGTVIDYELDSHQRIEHIRRDGVLVASLDYNNSVEPANQIAFANQLTAQRQWDDRQRVASIDIVHNSTTLWTQQYTYNQAQNLQRINTTNNGIDAGSQANVAALLSSVNQSLTTSYYTGTDRIHEQRDSNGTLVNSYSYDADGNTRQINGQQLHYNAAGRLVSIEDNGSTIATYSYDAYGRRVMKQVGNDTTLFYYDKQGRLLEETDGNNTLLRQYIYGDGLELIAVFNAVDNQLYYIHTDYQGAPLFLSDSNRNIVWSSERTPHGQTLITVENTHFPLRFSNQYYDAESGFNYNEQRYYNTASGTYLRPDPIGLEGGHNPYQFALGNPTRYIDPDGRAAVLLPLLHPTTWAAAGKLFFHLSGIAATTLGLHTVIDMASSEEEEENTNASLDTAADAAVLSTPPGGGLDPNDPDNQNKNKNSDGTFLRDSRTVNFSQDSIRGTFDDGQGVSTLVARLRYQSSYANQIEPIRLVRFRDLPAAVRANLTRQGVSSDAVFSLDNRRLYAARLAKVSIRSRWATPSELSSINLVRRFSTVNGGRLPFIR